MKNAAELAGMREAHLRDGAALVRFLCWLEKTIASGGSCSVHLFVGIKGSGGMAPRLCVSCAGWRRGLLERVCVWLATEAWDDLIKFCWQLKPDLTDRRALKLFTEGPPPLLA